ncbi:hypothetical protein K438DRAFT_1971008 [Mycena galopus ATCC 62051]|nr:hypothetical protein K438DRAFT_1971008 [Mycena galopus ATCC 62051]
MAWNEVVDATIPHGTVNEESLNAYIAPSSSTSPISPDFGFTFDSETGLNEADEFVANIGFPEARAAEQTAVDAFLQRGQRHPRDNHVQEEQRFLVYQISDTENLIMDNMIDEDVLIPTRFICDHDFDIIS